MRYYGGKEKLLDLIEKGVKYTELNHGAKFVDLFSGTSVVSQHFKKLGYTVVSNDFLEFSHSLAKTYIELNEEPKFSILKRLLGPRFLGSSTVIHFLNHLDPVKGFISQNYSPDGSEGRKYFSSENAQKIDAIREKIQEWKESEQVTSLEYYYLLTSLLEAVNRVSNVAGTYGAYLKTWDSRALNPLTLLPPAIIPSKRKNIAQKRDANALSRELKSVDILYLDPPYNNRQYAANYFILELIAEGWFGSAPIVKGKTGITDYRHLQSDYGYKDKALKALDDLISHSKAKYILLSYNNEGLISPDQIRDVLSKSGDLKVFTKKHRRYRSINQTQEDPTTTVETLYVLKTGLASRRANKLDGATWLKHSFSIWRDITKNKEETDLNHPAIFPIQLAERVIKIFTNGSGKAVLDCFAGSGSSLIAGLKLGMNVYGVDTSKEYRDLFLSRISKSYPDLAKNSKAAYHVGSSLSISNFLQPESIDLVLTSPPYWNVLNERRSADGKAAKSYSESKIDIGNIDNYDIFLEELKHIMSAVAVTLKSGGYCVLVVMDIRKGNRFYPFHSDVSILMQALGFSFEDIIIWDRQKEYNNSRPLGYPYKFIVNKIHEYILVFRKNG